MMIMMAILVGNLKPNNPTENMFMPPFYLFMMMMKLTIILMVMAMVIKNQQPNNPEESFPTLLFSLICKITPS